jgi:two-component system, chemotaxis family, chemotaxis protein CheY
MRSSATRRILIVDDSVAVRASLESLLEPFGFEVEHAEDGTAGLRRCGASRYDLVLLDLHMPVMDGPTMLRFLRQWGNKTPVVLVTSASDTKLLSSVIKLGNADYVCKPFDPRQIHAALCRTLGLPPDQLVAETPRVLVVDPEEVTAELLRGALPPHVAVDVAAGPEAAEALAGQRGYRLVLVDGVSGGRDAADGLGRRLRALQPEAGLFLLDDPERTSDARRRGGTGPFDGAVPRPPEARVVQDFLYPSCLRNLVLTGGASVALAAFRGLDEDVGIYFEVAARRLLAAIRTTLREVAGLRVDLSRAPHQPERVARLVGQVLQATEELVVDPSFVVSAAMREALTAAGEHWPAPVLTPGQG